MPGEQQEVAALRQLAWVERVKRELIGVEVTRPVERRAKLAEQRGEALEVGEVRGWNDVEILGRADMSVRTDREAPMTM